MLAVFEQDQVAATAEIAIKAQRLASEVGLRLYAGFHFGPVQFRLTDGHPDAVGQTINFVARLHKMAEDAPGQIFLLEESLSQLPHALRTQAMPFGNRSLKGLGKFNVWTLGWQSQNAPTATVLAAERETAISSTTLHLRHGDNSLTCLSQDRKKLIGRGNTCDLVVPDPELKVSSTHATIECIDDCWFLHPAGHQPQRHLAQGRDRWQGNPAAVLSEDDAPGEWLAIGRPSLRRRPGGCVHAEIRDFKSLIQCFAGY